MSDKRIIKIAILAALCVMWWPEIVDFFNPKPKKKAEDEDMEIDSDLDMEIDDPHHLQTEVCETVIYQPLSLVGLHQSDLLPKGICYTGDSYWDDKPYTTGDPYADEQAEDYKKFKAGESELDGLDQLVLILNNTTDEDLDTTIGDVVTDESAWGGGSDPESEPEPEDPYFTMLIDTEEAGSANDTMIIPLTGSGYDFTVDWGDGTVESKSGTAPATQHTYSIPGQYVVKITGAFPRIYFNNSGDRQKLIEIQSWGDIVWESMNAAFYGCSNLISATGNLNLSLVANSNTMFSNCTNLVSVDSSEWDTSNIMNMSFMFNQCSSLSALDVSGWNTSSVTSMSNMFAGSSLLKIDLSSFNITSVTNITGMLLGCNINAAGTTTNYDNTLVSWAAQLVNSGLSFHGGTSQYSVTGQTARNTLTGAPNNWTIDDGGLI